MEVASRMQPVWEFRFPISSLQGEEATGVVAENSTILKTLGFRSFRKIVMATAMNSLFVALFALVVSSFRTRAGLEMEILALRHQLAVFQENSAHRLRLHRCDRFLWIV